MRGREAEKEKRKEIIFLKLEAKIETLEEERGFHLGCSFVIKDGNRKREQFL